MGGGDAACHSEILSELGFVLAGRFALLHRGMGSAHPGFIKSPGASCDKGKVRIFDFVFRVPFTAPCMVNRSTGSKSRSFSAVFNAIPAFTPGRGQVIGSSFVLHDHLNTAPRL